ncbi:SMEK domain-containing protein [Stenotrophomonas sp.]|uniref:SMEK domain-containing protein n=1 Tax=Stenotrophomonas sp. TaxID=69392 RepID=UPI0029B5BB6D|nr:SMEK domain-containing protein [Stenotrophomonas sp.]MDX3935786.1 SMEK domain-containing protein [Stenotrophomonas sp.]
MNTTSLVHRLAIYLAAYKHYLDFKTQAGLLDAAVLGEAVALDLARITWGYTDLENLNLKHNFPAVDLGTKSGDCAIQVTVTSSSTKIVETQEKFLEHGIMNTYARLIFVILGEKQASYDSQRIVRSQGKFTFDPEKDIYDLNDLYNIVAKGGDAAKVAQFADRIEQELSDKIRPFLVGVDKPGQNLRRLFEAHDVSIANAVEPLKKFGITRSIFSNNTRLSEAADLHVVPYIADEFSVASDWINGSDGHIYNAQPGLVPQDWRRSLEKSYQVIREAISNSEELILLIPGEVGLNSLDRVKDVADVKSADYQHFFLAARKKNDFGEYRYRMAISEPLSYKCTRDGIFLMFLAAEIHQAITQETIYISVVGASRDELLSCYSGDRFLVDLIRGAPTLGNQRDFVQATNYGFMARRIVSASTVRVLQQMLTDFTSKHQLPTNAVVHR